MRLVLSQEGGSHFDFAPLSLENNRSLTRYRPFGAWVVDLADGYDFEAPVFVRIEIRAVEGACGVFKVGKAWEFNGVPTFDGVEDGEKKYSVSFPDFDEVQ
jgi:hypothetical protein